MSNGQGSGVTALIFLLLFAYLIPIVIGVWIIWAILAFITNHPDETIAFISGTARVVGWILLAPQYAMAWLLLTLFRNLSVEAWPVNHTSDTAERMALAVWLAGIPVVVTPLWWSAVYAVLQGVLVAPGWLTLILSLASATAFVGCYYWLYWNRPPKHHNWPIFEAQHQKTRFVVQSELALRWLRVKLTGYNVLDEINK